MLSAKPLYVLFGLSGSGKTYVGRLLNEKLGLFHVEGDDFLTTEMRGCISQNEPFTQEMRDAFTRSLIRHLQRITNVSSENSRGVLLTQALYKEKNREMIRQAFPSARFIQVCAEDETLVRRVRIRDENVKSEYIEKIRIHFENPRLATSLKFIDNGKDATDESILRQFLSASNPYSDGSGHGT